MQKKTEASFGWFSNKKALLIKLVSESRSFSSGWSPYPESKFEAGKP
jgi:hypothetical protein